MKLGLFGINTGPCAQPQTAARVARAAEAAGYDSVWTGEHVVLPDPQVPPSPAPPQTPMLDPAASLAFLAGQTESLLLGTGIIILPQRNPVVLAKSLASVDVLSGGRLMFGLGAGYLAPEFEAVGAAFEGRGQRTDEYIDAIRALWTMEQPRFAGATVRFSGIDAQPRPVQRPHPPIVVGGTSPPALRRAVSRGNGWYGFFRDLDATRTDLDGLAAARTRVERPAALGELGTSITPLPGCDADTAARYRDLGIDRLVLFAAGRDADSLVRFVEENAETIGRKVA
jgi:probable F420-dependent oxidoreductase